MNTSTTTTTAIYIPPKEERFTVQSILFTMICFGALLLCLIIYITMAVNFCCKKYVTITIENTIKTNEETNEERTPLNVQYNNNLSLKMIESKL